MMQLLKDFFNLLLYGNFWIALCATAMGLQNQYLLQGQIRFSPFIGLLFFSTLLVYALHRIVGISRLKDFLKEERYAVIYRYRHHIKAYAVVGALGAIYFFFRLPRSMQLELLMPGIISLAYVWPVLTRKRRLRDIDHIKIFLIAIVYSWVTVRLPALEVGHSQPDLSQFFLLVERALFIFAITLPFDIRDLVVDQHSQVSTIPAKIGIAKSKYLAYVCLFIAFGLSLANHSFYSSPGLLAMGLSYLSTAGIISFSDTQKHDYLFTGLLDGTMGLQFLLVYWMV